MVMSEIEHLGKKEIRDGRPAHKINLIIFVEFMSERSYGQHFKYYF
jgi:hypothetical protein